MKILNYTEIGKILKVLSNLGVLAVEPKEWNFKAVSAYNGKADTEVEGKTVIGIYPEEIGKHLFFQIKDSAGKDSKETRGDLPYLYWLPPLLSYKDYPSEKNGVNNNLKYQVPRNEWVVLLTEKEVNAILDGKSTKVAASLKDLKETEIDPRLIKAAKERTRKEGEMEDKEAKESNQLTLFKEDYNEINPSHYQTKGGLQSIDVIEAFDLGFNLGNTFKYIARAGKKPGVPKEKDLSKALWYLIREMKNAAGVEKTMAILSSEIMNPLIKELNEERAKTEGDAAEKAGDNS